jgi:hypothetical protein
MALLDLPLSYRDIDQLGDFDRTFPGNPWAHGRTKKPREKFKEDQRNQRNIQLPSGNLLHSYGKSPFIGDFPMEKL